MKIGSHNEWDTLREIVVGTAENAVACLTIPDTANVSDEALTEARQLAKDAYPKSMIEEVEEDLADLCSKIEEFGATVHRPGGYDPSEIFSSPGWAATGNNLYNMRDLHLVVGNAVIESPSPSRHRLHEASGLHDIWYQYFEEGFQWIAGPTPRLRGSFRIPFEENGDTYTRLAENEILFDAANTVRMGRDLLYLVSSSGNYLGAKWLQSVLGEDYVIHTTEGIYRSSHIDSTVMCLRPGLVLFCADRVNDDNCPALFDKWEKIYFDDIVSYPPDIKEFHEKTRAGVAEKISAFGIETDIRTMSSPWIGMNLLSLDPETVLVDQRQEPLIRLLETKGFNVLPTRMRHSYTMKGGIHCSTLDTVRDSKLESYFD